MYKIESDVYYTTNIFPDFPKFFVQVMIPFQTNDPIQVKWVFVSQLKHNKLQNRTITHVVEDHKAYKVFATAILAPTLWNDRQFGLRKKSYCTDQVFTYGSHPLFCIESLDWKQNDSYYLVDYHHCMYCNEDHCRGCCAVKLKDWRASRVIFRNSLDFCSMTCFDMYKKKQTSCSSCKRDLFEHEFFDLDANPSYISREQIFG